MGAIWLDIPKAIKLFLGLCSILYKDISKIFLVEIVQNNHLYRVYPDLSFLIQELIFKHK